LNRRRKLLELGLLEILLDGDEEIELLGLELMLDDIDEDGLTEDEGELEGLELILLDGLEDIELLIDEARTRRHR